jgi:hypothetical protein
LQQDILNYSVDMRDDQGQKPELGRHDWSPTLSPGGFTWNVSTASALECALNSGQERISIFAHEALIFYIRELHQREWLPQKAAGPALAPGAEGMTPQVKPRFFAQFCCKPIICHIEMGEANASSASPG